MIMPRFPIGNGRHERSKSNESNCGHMQGAFSYLFLLEKSKFSVKQAELRMPSRCNHGVKTSPTLNDYQQTQRTFQRN
jgi:hypothetical protein